MSILEKSFKVEIFLKIYRNIRQKPLESFHSFNRISFCYQLLNYELEYLSVSVHLEIFSAFLISSTLGCWKLAANNQHELPSEFINIELSTIETSKRAASSTDW